MEKEGFVRGVGIFDGYELAVQTLVTDRHKQLSKWIRENLPEVRHPFDVPKSKLHLAFFLYF